MGRRKGKQAALLERQLLERVISPEQLIETLRRLGGWVTARDVANVLSGSTFKLAFQLRRMTEEGVVEEDVVEVVGPGRIREHSRLYRVRPGPGEVRRVETPYPAWLCPQAVVGAGEGRRVEGAAGMRRWDEDEDG